MRFPARLMMNKIKYVKNLQNSYYILEDFIVRNMFSLNYFNYVIEKRNISSRWLKSEIRSSIFEYFSRGKRKPIDFLAKCIDIGELHTDSCYA